LNTLETIQKNAKVQKEAESEWQAVAFEGYSLLLRLLSPIAPHITQVLWHTMGFGEDILTAQWPEANLSALVQDEVEYVIQVNGKLRASMLIAKSMEKAQIEAMAVSLPALQKFLEEGTVKKVIVVPNKLVNIVVA
jgi:leucyl-tRNA synthetase